jgi:acylglycerol lipase
MRPLSFGDAPPSRREAERMLAVPTRLLLEARERNPALARLDLEAALERLEHEWLSYRGKRIHVEVHPVGTPSATFVVAHGLGDHGRRQLGLSAALAEHDYAVVVVDRQGHGLSEGRRGDAPLEDDLGVLELTIRLARERFGGPVVILGDSLGGVMSWYLLTREPDVEAAVCHCIGHPDVHPDPSFRYKEPLLRALAKVAPQAPISVRQIADYGQVSLDPITKRYFDDEVDDLFNFNVTARSVASYLGFRPQIPWERVQTPTLVMIGADDGLVTPEFTCASFERAHPPHAEYLSVPAAGHQLFLDHLDSAMPPLFDWASRALSSDVAA